MCQYNLPVYNVACGRLFLIASVHSLSLSGGQRHDASAAIVCCVLIDVRARISEMKPFQALVHREVLAGFLAEPAPQAKYSENACPSHLGQA